MERWLTETMLEFSARRPQAHLLIKGLTGGSVKEALAELRAVDPKAAMMLGEFVVLDDDDELA